jgi:thiamine-monophosphate kinase
MALTEFQIIDRFFSQLGAKRADVQLGVGDDAALLQTPAGESLVAAIDTMVFGTHFLADTPPASVGHRALAVNLSDLAAMGAKPAWALLALTLPRVDEAWLEGFARGFRAIAQEHDVALVGGDTTAGGFCVSVQVLGHVPRGAALLRSGGKPGDAVFVSGTPGDSAAGFAISQNRLNVPDAEARDYLLNRFLYPTPRVALGLRLRDYASACIDVSDGLLGDAGKMAAASQCGVEIAFEQLPLSPALVTALGDEEARRLALTGGEDFELCFCVPQQNVARMEQELPPSVWSYRRIGVLKEAPGVAVFRAGTVMEFSHSGFDHFASRS